MDTEAALERLEQITREAADLVKIARLSLNPEKVRRAGTTPPKPDYFAKEKTLIWKAIWGDDRLTGKFTLREVRKRIRIMLGRKYWESTYISPCLAEWADEGYIDVVSKGSGPKPTVYEIPTR